METENGGCQRLNRGVNEELLFNGYLVSVIYKINYFRSSAV